MIGKLVMVISMILLIMLSAAWIYQGIPHDPVRLKTSGSLPVPVEIIDYGATPVFAENLRFNHNAITYSISASCDPAKKTAMREAFNIYENLTRYLTFTPVISNPDIIVKCSDDYIPLGDNLFAAGEGGPSRIINTSTFKTIEEGSIYLYESPDCSYPIVELHELGHVFGFDHSPDPKNIMYNVSNCDQRISQDMISLLDRLYSIEALPDASISELSAIKKGAYLDFNITILNEGLMGIENLTLTLVANGNSFQTMELGDIDIGYGRTLQATNVRLPSAGVQRINFVLDEQNLIRELSETNNIVEMVIESQ